MLIRTWKAENQRVYSDFVRRIEAVRKGDMSIITEMMDVAKNCVPEEIQIRAVARFYQADENCGKGIAEQLAICLDSVLDEVKRQKELGY